MRSRPRRTITVLVMSAALLSAVVTSAPAYAAAPEPTSVPLDQYFDNDGIDTASARGGDFDGSGYSFPGDALLSGRASVDGMPFAIPSSAAGAKNNIVAFGQLVAVPRGRYHSAHFLVAGSYGMAGGAATVHYADGGTSTASLSRADWYGASGQIVAPFLYAPDGKTDQSPVSLSVAQLWLDASREAVLITLPVTKPAQAGQTSLHVFALTVQGSSQARHSRCADPVPRPSFLTTRRRSKRS